MFATVNPLLSRLSPPTDFSCFSFLPPESLFDTLQKMYLSHLGQGQTMRKVRYTLGQLIFKQIIYKSEEMVSAQVKHGFVLKFRYKCHGPFIIMDFLRPM